MQVREVKLSKGKTAIVDLDDFDRVSQFNWCASLDGRGATWYALRWTRKNERPRWRSQHIRLGHFILDRAVHELPPDYIIEHENQNSLDYRKSNLRICHKALNMLLSPRWKKATGVLYGGCANCETPIFVEQFLCYLCESKGVW